MSDSSYAKYVEGRTLLASNEHEAALLCFLASHGESPHFKTALSIADCYEHIGERLEVEAYVKQAYRLHPNSNEAATRYAQGLFASRDYVQCTEVIESVLARSPDYGQAQVLRASLTTKD